MEQRQAVALLRQDLKSALSRLDAVDVALNQNQVNAFADFIYNVGGTAWDTSTLLKRLNAGDFSAIPGQLKLWHWAHTKAGVLYSVPALVQRRKDETALLGGGGD